MYFFLAVNKESKTSGRNQWLPHHYSFNAMTRSREFRLFDASTLSREDDLGKQMSFAEAVKPVEAIIAVYKRIPLSSPLDFTDNQLNAINSQANADFSDFKQILDFNAAAGDAVNTRSTMLSRMRGLESKYVATNFSSQSGSMLPTA
jgi:hypothetical protein